MVSTSTIIAMCVTLFVSLLLPIIVYIMYGVKNKGKGVWTAWLLGAAGFFVMQILIRIPLLQLIVHIAFTNVMSFVEDHYVLYALQLAFTAALFEVIGRFVVAKILRKNLNFERGIAAGLGHGGIEAIVIVGLTYVNNLTYSVMINTGSFDTMIDQVAAMGIDASQYYQIKETLIASTSGIFYMAGYERLLTMIFHVAMSLMVCYAVSQKKTLRGVLLCLVIHCAVDFITAVFSGMAMPYMGEMISAEMSYVLVYTYLTIVAVLSVLYIRAISKKWKEV